ncbi:MAG: protein kinase domain-containing protein [Planctomycetota bacterium]|jgi:non-specific serine/threonine protein kinase
MADGFPEKLGPYVREEKLGGGGMGVVYRYREEFVDRVVAIKSIREDHWSREDYRARFKDEAKALARLAGEPHVGQYLHHIEHDGRIYLVLEYVGGPTLTEVIRQRSVSVERALGICLQLARALKAGHARGIVHRDVKPDNIKLTTGGQLKLLDYGLAWLREALQSAIDPGAPTVVDGDERGRHTRSAHVVGTPGYMSPEQTRGEADLRTDIFVWAIVLFECLTGRRAFDGPTRQAIAEAIRSRDPDYDALPALPPGIEDLLRRCLAKDREDRPASMDEVVETLESCRARGAGEKRPGLPVAQNLPTETEPFIGREDELRMLSELAGGARIVTITGMGGVGKTRLATTFARRCLRPEDDWLGVLPFPDGVFFVELGAVSTSRRVPQAVAAAMRGARGLPSRTGTVTDAIVAELRDKRVLLVLDGCEQMRDACVKLAARLVECPAVTVVTTSQEPLDPRQQTIPERHLHLNGLSCPETDTLPGRIKGFDAVRLFSLAARTVRPDFAVTARNREAVARICRRLDGNPLAIRIAATGTADGDVRDLEKHLGEITDLQAVLSESIAWGIGRLDDTERQLLRRFVVFRGGGTVEAAKAVCADNGGGLIKGRSIFELLRALAGKSLLVYEEHEDRSRYRLPEIVQWYCEKNLGTDAGLLESLRRRHLDFYLHVVERAHERLTGDEPLEGHESAAWMNRIQSDLGNMRAAWCTSAKASPDLAGRLARALQPFWYVRNYLKEGQSTLEEAIRLRGDDARDPLQSRLFNAAGILAARRGKLDVATCYYRQSIDIAREARSAGDDDGRCLAGPLTNLGLVLQEQGDLAGARRRHGEAIEIYREIGDGVLVASGELNLAVVAKCDETHDEARALLNAALPVFERRNDVLRIAAAHRNFGEIARREQRWDDATRELRAGLRSVAPLRNKTEVADCLDELAFVSASVGNWIKSARLLGAAFVLRNFGREAGAAVGDEPPLTIEQLRSSAPEQEQNGCSEAYEAGALLSYDEAVHEGLSP